MLISYTFQSYTLGGEESVTLLMPHPHMVADHDAYTYDDLLVNRTKLPVLFAMGDIGTENSWWMRYTYAEADVQRMPCAVVCVRGMAPNEQTLRFVRKELPESLCAQYPLDAARMTWFSPNTASGFADELAREGPYQRVLRDADMRDMTDSASAIEKAIRIASGRDR